MIGYYLRHQAEVDTYLVERQHLASLVQQEAQRRFNPIGIRDRLLARRNPQGWTIILLLADENFNNQIVRGILRRNLKVDIVRIQDMGLTGVDDPTVLEWVCKIIYVLVSINNFAHNLCDCVVSLCSTRNDKYIFNFALLLINSRCRNNNEFCLRTSPSRTSYARII